MTLLFFFHQELKATYTNSSKPPKLGALKLSPFVCSQTLSHGTVANVRTLRCMDNSKFKVSDNTVLILSRSMTRSHNLRTQT
jgi:hypothetical protein